MLAEIIWDQDKIALVCVFSVPIIGILAGVWSHVESRKSDNELKRSMVERGMSAEEIERVIAAKAPKE